MIEKQSIHQHQPSYQNLIVKISATYAQGQVKAAHVINVQLLETYWQIGEHIVEFEQGGNVRAEYGKALISKLATDLSVLHGKGFSRSNIVYMRLLYLNYPISQKPSHQLSWSHFVELLKIDNELERKFYEKQSIAEKWSVPQLKRQKNTALFQRLALSKNKEEILKLSAHGQGIATASDIKGSVTTQVVFTKAKLITNSYPYVFCCLLLLAKFIIDICPSRNR